MQDKYVFMGLVVTIIIIWLLSYLNQSDEYLQSVKPPKKRKPKKSKKESLTIVKKFRNTGGYTIRQPNEQKPIKKETSTIVLDEKKLGNLRQQTQIAQELLSDIFTEEEEVHLPDSKTSNAVVEALQKLLEKDTWQREEVQELLGTNVMIGNMLEQINDYAYSKVDDIVVEEDGDTIYVTTEYKEQLI